MLKLVLKKSFFLHLLLVLSYFGAFIAILFCAIPMLLKTILCFLCILSLVLAIKRTNHTRTILLSEELEIIPQKTVITRYLVILCIEKSVFIPIFYDMTDQNDFRKLCKFCLFMLSNPK